MRIVEKDPKAGESSKTYTADATQDFQQQNHSFQSVSGYFAFTGPDNFKLIGNSQPTPATGILVAEGFFQTLGVEPSVGTSVQAGRIRTTRPARCIVELSVLETQARLAIAASSGSTINLNNTSVTVIGVLPETFDFGSVFSPGRQGRSLRALHHGRFPRRRK